MQLYIDTANLDEIKEAAALGVLDGVTTNPSLIAKEKGVSYTQRLTEICAVVKGPVSAEVSSIDYAGMMKEADQHLKSASNIINKLPITVDGIKT